MSFLDETEVKRVDNAQEQADAAQRLVKLSAALDKRDEEIKAEFKKLADMVAQKSDKADYDAQVKKVEELAEKAQGLADQILACEQKLSRPMGGAAGATVKSLGEMVAEDEGVKAMREGKARVATIQLKSFERKNVGPVTSASASAGVLVDPMRVGMVRPEDQDLRIRSLLMPGVTASNAIEYFKENVFTNSAAPVAELALKPQSDITFSKQSTTVKTLAHWIYASKQIMDDVPMLMSYINGRLIYGLRLVEEQQLLLGDGTGENLLGIIPQATAYDATLITTLGVTNVNKMDVIRAAMLQVQLSLYEPTGIVLHPTDWAAITLTKDSNGNYLVANPQSTLSRVLWSLPVVPSMSMSQGTFLVGSFRYGAQFFDREAANIAVSYEDRDNFVKNAVTIRAEERLALAVYRPAAFVAGSFSGSGGDDTTSDSDTSTTSE